MLFANSLCTNSMNVDEECMRIYLGTKAGDEFLQKFEAKHKTVIWKLINGEKRKVGDDVPAKHTARSTVSTGVDE